MLKYWLTFHLCLFSFLTVIAQNAEINELKARLNNTQTREQVYTLNRLCILLKKNKPDEAKVYAEKAEQIASKIGFVEGQADAFTELGSLNAYHFDMPNLAYDYHRKAFELYKKLYEKGDIDKEVIFSFLNYHAIPAFEYIDEKAKKNKRDRKALEGYHKLYTSFIKYITTLSNKSDEELSKIEKELENTKNQAQKTETDLNKAKQNIQNKDNEILMKSYNEKKLALEKLKLSGSLEEKELEAIALSDSLMLKQLELKDNELKLNEEKQKAEKLEQEKALQTAENERQRLFNIALIVGIILLATLAVVIFISLRNQRRTSKLLAIKNEEINQQKEEIEAQRDNLEDLNAELKQQSEEIIAQRDNLQELNDAILLKNQEIAHEKNQSDELLLNILPASVAEELKAKGSVTPKYYEQATVLFTDFKGFTQISEQLTPEGLIQELNTCFLAFDDIITRFGLEKIKTIGDAYMCVGGLPAPNQTNAFDAVSAALAMRTFMEDFKNEKLSRGEPVWELRIGLHTGSLVAGVIGKNKFVYDIWGDTVNTASRMESASEAGKINISETTYQIIKDQFQTTYRGKIAAKNKGEIEMYYVEGLK
ncbi:MAG: hypothetical protein EAZ55_03030 [Cytophagales bacterium]|nr:MAG: hypothetical protein EAZ55_03030 [Cytophagales bacterium]